MSLSHILCIGGDVLTCRNIFNRKRFKELRIQNGFKTQKVFADTIGKDQSFISKIEKGTEYPSLKVINEMATVLGVPVYELISERGVPDC